MTTEKHIHTDLPLTLELKESAPREGAYYKHGSPERKKIAEPGTPGIKLILKGHVLDRGSNPVHHAWLDCWQADGEGKYDMEGFNLRGHQYAGHNGEFYLETVKPAGYENRAAHINVKVRDAKNSPILTTQLFFPDDDRNCDDPLFEEENVVDLADVEGGQEANFDFVIKVQQPRPFTSPA